MKKKHKITSTKKFIFLTKRKNIYKKINKITLLKFPNKRTFLLNFNKIREQRVRNINFFIKCPKLNTRLTLFKKLYYKKKRNFLLYLFRNYKSTLPNKKYQQKKKFYTNIMFTKLRYQKIRKY